ncbi:hypothetical protein RZO55_07815 [Clostridium boliviensis]|uniref:Deoxynucleoside kinase domain-containing protein n=1 Tax=Clostridium boliviensis TaxID=318465 RepID=A0ABU4GIP0_9CLOT|nr:hypothetical protein [Clostridium boliviensis]MDW2797479.1 hypothetical protein [Clostridium boliviensis]
MNNIFVEGIQGSGKSTLLNKLQKDMPEYTVYREGDISPIELAWCSYMTKEQYEKICIQYKDIYKELEAHTVTEEDKKITAYTQILTDIQGFHKYMEQFEIYNGNIKFNLFKKIILERYANLYGGGTIFECSFFQNSIECMLLYYQMCEVDIIDFYSEAFDILKSKNFKLLYINAVDIEGTIDTIKKERKDDQGNEIWFTLMLQYLEKSPYGIKHNLHGAGDLISHLKRRKDIELKIVNEIIGKNALIIGSKNYDINEILVWSKLQS